MARIVSSIARSLSERFTSSWRLLSETTAFLSRTSAFEHYEAQLRELRSRLQASRDDDRMLGTVRKEIVELRSSLRLQGYDLSLGSLDLSVKGFRSDASLAEGYKRVVVFIGERGIRALGGSGNHVEIHDLLEAEIARNASMRARSKHYLWYRWERGLLSISGSATETAEDFERFQAWSAVPENGLALLSAMRKMS